MISAGRGQFETPQLRFLLLAERENQAWSGKGQISQKGCRDNETIPSGGEKVIKGTEELVHADDVVCRY